jgi:hypothetical protein
MVASINVSLEKVKETLDRLRITHGRISFESWRCGTSLMERSIWKDTQGRGQELGDSRNLTWQHYRRAEWPQDPCVALESSRRCLTSVKRDVFA